DGSGFPSAALINEMGFDSANAKDKQNVKYTVQFLRGGISAYGSRDEVLNAASPTLPSPLVGPAGQFQYSYFYQDDIPAPGANPPQLNEPTDNSAPKGYSHKLGDIFHSSPLLLEPPKNFPFLASGLTPAACAPVLS